MIIIMKTFGFRVNNDALEKNSWYFRNALVRANYNNLQKGIHSTTRFLEMFFDNLLLDTDHELKNRFMHVDYVVENNSQSVNPKDPKAQFDTLDCTLEELYPTRKRKTLRQMGTVVLISRDRFLNSKCSVKQNKVYNWHQIS